MSTESDNTNSAQAATELYWGSDRSVNQIAEDLDLSKSALYDLIRPLQSGRACPDCQNEVVFPNRTARDRRMLACPNCGWEGAESEVDRLGGEGSVTLPTYEAVDDVEAPPRLHLTRGRAVAGGALLGAAAGLALVFWARRDS